ncbi:MAG: GxxExxY protein [Verrucomicrobia bacterium]|nr:GxxExxY protein [Verrucomicrobiota bacterium]MBU4248110.1 GxxExxY protein [Verrucomicrobiota bacterium]MBU4290786.1 GxxExxY protein [Verrucomicrobiota bacterium]MBU4429739.1 GxxExxY protein [Verrucomicrobiota bacterium]MBU4497458.1 GxxExxY protein [Verrucomicrobiota bacterium]
MFLLSGRHFSRPASYPIADRSHNANITACSNFHYEAAYQKCLRKEFKLRGLGYKEKPRLQISYQGEMLDQCYEPDFLCHGKIILE